MEQRIEVELNGETIAREEFQHLPDVRWYRQAEAMELYQDVGFTNIQIFRSFELTLATPDDRGFCVLGVKPESPVT